MIIHSGDTQGSYVNMQRTTLEMKKIIVGFVTAAWMSGELIKELKTALGPNMEQFEDYFEEVW